MDSGTEDRFRNSTEYGFRNIRLIQEQKMDSRAEDGFRNRRWIQEQKLDSREKNYLLFNILNRYVYKYWEDYILSWVYKAEIILRNVNKEINWF